MSQSKRRDPLGCFIPESDESCNIAFTLKLTKSQLEFIKSQGNSGAYVRSLIIAEMQKQPNS
jgi:hypothetical protein